MAEEVQFNFADGDLHFAFLGSEKQQQQHQQQQLQQEKRQRKRRQGAGTAAAAAAASRATSAAASRLQQQHKRLKNIERGHERHMQLLRKQQEQQLQDEVDSDENTGLSRVAHVSRCLDTRQQQLKQQQQLEQFNATAAIAVRKKKKKMRKTSQTATQRAGDVDMQESTAVNSGEISRTTRPQSTDPPFKRKQKEDAAASVPLLEGTAQRAKEEGERKVSRQRQEPQGAEEEQKGQQDLATKQQTQQQEVTRADDDEHESQRSKRKRQRRRRQQEEQAQQLSGADEGEWEDELNLEQGWGASASNREQQKQQQKQQQEPRQWEKMRGKTKGGRSIVIRRMFDKENNTTKRKTKTRSRQKNIKKDNRSDHFVSDGCLHSPKPLSSSLSPHGFHSSAIPTTNLARPSSPPSVSLFLPLFLPPSI